jgi:hypothetical protein
VGACKNPGRAWAPAGQPHEVNRPAFPAPKLGQAIPAGVYDRARNEGGVRVGMDRDTAAFATARIRRCWQEMGVRRFPRATRLRIAADGGGRNSSRHRLWKVRLRKPARTILGYRWRSVTFPGEPATGTRASIGA